MIRLLGFIKSWPCVLLGATLILLGISIGHHRATLQCIQQQTDQQTQSAHIASAQAQTTTEVLTQYVDRVQVIRQRGADIIKEVPVYVPQTDAACSLPGPWRLLHDAAATGSLLPESSAAAHAAPVAAQVAAHIVTHNYAACHVNAEQLVGLQEWVRAQQHVTNVAP